MIDSTNVKRCVFLLSGCWLSGEEKRKKARRLLELPVLPVGQLMFVAANFCMDTNVNTEK